MGNVPSWDERMIMTMLSKEAWVVLKQLKAGPAFDGDLVSKQGRTELMKNGLVRRDRQFPDGPYRGCQMNELTETGVTLAATVIDLDERFGAIQ